MANRDSACKGCLLGLAVGDAMGYTVDERTWDEIREDYGPNGLLGYDLANGSAEASSYTQVAAYVGNGLLLGTTRGKQSDYLRYISVSLREWARSQHFPRDPERSYCWVSKISRMRKRRCKDARMLDALRMDPLGTPERPINRTATAGGLPGAIMVGLAYDPKYLQPYQVGILGAQTVALTHGNALAFLSGSVLANCIAGILHEPELTLKEQFLQGIAAMESRYGEKFPQSKEVSKLLNKAVVMAEMEEDPQQAMEELNCRDAHECLAGAMFACLRCPEDFDAGIILAVNHSGRSAAVGAVAGAILGAKLGVEALPEFYLESLECADVLTELAGDFAVGSPMSGLFDDDWDHKYIQGLSRGIE